MSSDYSPFPQGPPIVHRDEPPAPPLPPVPDEGVSPRLPAARDLMAQARLWEGLEPFPGDWVVTFESGIWIARLDPEVQLTAPELELGYGRTITNTTRRDLLDAVRGRDEMRAGPWT